MIKNLLRKNYLFILIFFLAFGLRIYKMDVLTTFGRDQGIDFISVKDMLEQRHISLIGIKASVGEFFQGPLLRLSLIPLFSVVSFNPLAGAITAVGFSLASLTILYVTGISFFRKTSALLSSLFFATSQGFISFGNTPLYQNFAVLPILLSIFAFGLGRYLLAGLMAGIAVEYHFLSIVLVGTLLIYIVFFVRSAKILFLYLSGVLFGVLPTIIFEFRHQFLNTHFLLSLLSKDSHLTYNPFIIQASAVGILAMFFLKFFFKNEKNNSFLMFKRLVIICFLLNSFFILSLSNFELHYPLVLWLLLILFIPSLLGKLKREYIIAVGILIVLVNSILTIPYLKANHGFTMPEGWSLKKINQVANFIESDSKTHKNFNVASLIDGDTRTYPLRYVLLTKNLKFGEVNEYPQNNSLYLVAKNEDQNIINSSVWEIFAFKPIKIALKKDFGDGIYLYRIDRKN